MPCFLVSGLQIRGTPGLAVQGLKRAFSFFGLVLGMARRVPEFRARDFGELVLDFSKCYETRGFRLAFSPTEIVQITPVASLNGVHILSRCLHKMKETPMLKTVRGASLLHIDDIRSDSRTTHGVPNKTNA
eukprot:1292075-Amphidinium_carterae.1